MSATEWLLWLASVWTVWLAFAAIDVPVLLGRTVRLLRRQHLPHRPRRS